MTSASTGDSSIASSGARLARPSVFLMINNFEMGGSERQFVSLAKSLDREKWNLQLGCIRRRGPLAERLGDLPEFPLGGSLYGFHSLRTRLALRSHLKRVGIAVAHAFDFYANLTLVPAARLARVPVILGSHRQLGDLLTPAQFRAQLASFRWCDAVVCNSKAAADRLTERGLPESKVRIIGNGLLLGEFESTSASQSEVPGPFRIGMIARMNARYKNHELFLKAAARIATRIPDTRFALIGDGPLRPELEQKARDLGIAGKVDFLGERQDIPALLAQMDASVVPSASESLSNVILESMAAGVPVVASDVGGNRELLAENRGILVSPDQDEALAHALVVLLENPAQRAAIAGKSVQYVRAEYSLAAIQEKYSALYRELLDRKLPASRASFAASTTAGRLKVAIVAPTLRYVGGQAIQADLLLRQWHNDPDIAARFLPVDPSPPKFLGWVERIPGLRTLIREPIYLAHLWRDLRDVDIALLSSRA